ncbi:UPF0182 protein [Clostridium polyendosporum]|uniref:UPF0182 protein CPJCM30710_20570 n=1 Tax=Clostridium polyendosporum TaxID=69208 RepID=A0A919RZW7_9CLOT|nr:UPF0182 family protein [Clostridium polyendosporum]GIM29391.1 UPF0182 protein [Clostridium polyendosporum]
MIKKFWFIIAALFCFLMIIFLSSNLIVNIQWFSEMRYLSVYFTRLVATLKLIIPIFAICFATIYLYSKNITKKFTVFIEQNRRKSINRIIVVSTLIISIFMSFMIASTYWYRILQFTNSEPFRVNDPVFNKDISFYVFKLPLIQSIYNVLISILVIIGIITLITFVLVRLKNNVISIDNWRVSRGQTLKSFAGTQLAIVSSILMIMIAGGYILKSYYLLYSSSGIVFGAGYTDVKITLLFYKIITVVSLISSVIVFISIFKGRFKHVATVVSIIIGLIILEPILAIFVQQFIVKSNEMEFEKNYISNNIEATRKAFNIDNIKENNFEPKNSLDNNQLNNNKDIISNLKVNSISPVLNFYNQVQVIKNYYEFLDADTDRYYFNNNYTQVFIAPRELDNSNITTWQNKHLRYTHGYGVAMSKVNSVTLDGQPDFVMKDIPTENLTDISLDNPRIYFGEGSNDYAIVNTKVEELDYPKGGENQTIKYNGSAGIKISWFNRLLYSIYEGNIRILLSGDVNSDSKILINKNIIERVKKIAPFLSYDSDPYLVTNDGRLFWIIDAYTTSDKYPYSQPYNSINYVRNSIKVTVDAYNGNTDFYIVDEQDPIALSYSKIFKGLFKNSDQMPKKLKDHFKYPQDLFKVQCDVLGKYHMTNPIVFFTQEDLWEVSSNIVNVEGKEGTNESLYLMTRLPEEKNIEMILFEYFNMKGKQNMVALLGGRMDGQNYGKLVMYKFPPQKTILSPYLLKNKILSDSEISKEISLWQGKGSKVEYGDTVIIPINDSLFYLETIYLKADVEKSMPEVKKIIISDGERIVGAETVEKALEKLFKYSPQVEGGNLPINESSQIKIENNEDIKKAKDLYDKAIEAQKSGDWSTYGEYIKQLGEMLGNLSNK